MAYNKDYKSLPIFLARADGGIECITRNEDGNILTRAVYTDDGRLRSVYKYDAHGDLVKTKTNGLVRLFYPNGEIKARFNEQNQIIEEFDEKGELTFFYRYDRDGRLEQKLYSGGIVAEDYYYNGNIRNVYNEKGAIVAEFDMLRRAMAVYEYFDNGLVQYEHKYDDGKHYCRREFDENGARVCDRDTEGRLLAKYEDGMVKSQFSYKARYGGSRITDIFFYDGAGVLLSRVGRGVKETKDKAYLYDTNDNLLKEKEESMDDILRSLTEPYKIPDYRGEAL